MALGPSKKKNTSFGINHILFALIISACYLLCVNFNKFFPNILPRDREESGLYRGIEHISKRYILQI
jgi:hypothetical protein